ncbi:MAG TPA: hypothetical protein PKL52_11215 [Tenuifilaceae bacterium]|nr:hypothetical protein [Tenuifilaceae bacterium]
MNSRFMTAIVLVVGILLFSCGTGEKKVEYKKTYHRNGKVFEVIPYFDGKVHGTKLEYYESGTLRKETPYDSGYVHGNVKVYYPDGKLYSITLRVKGKIEGDVVKYHKNGNIQSITPYLNNKLQPGLKEYNPKGVLLDSPHIEFSLKKAKISNDLSVTLEARVSTGQKNVKFSQAVQLHEDRMDYVPLQTEDGVGKLVVKLPKGSSIDNTVLIRAELVTKYQNRCIVEGTYRIKASN